MIHLLLKWLIVAVALLLTAYIVPGIMVSSFYIALIVALILGLINLIFRPLLIILTLPINILTLGLFTFIINGFLFWFISTFVQGFTISGFWIAVLGSFIVSIFSYLMNIFLGGIEHPNHSQK